MTLSSATIGAKNVLEYKHKLLYSKMTNFFLQIITCGKEIIFSQVWGITLTNYKALILEYTNNSLNRKNLFKIHKFLRKRHCCTASLF